VDAGGDDPRDGEEGGEVVPFPGGRHPSQWPGDEPLEEDGAEEAELPFGPPDPAAGDYEPLPTEEPAGETYDLETGLSAARGDATEDDPTTAELENDRDPGTDDVEEQVSEAVGDEEDYEDFATGAGTFEEFTREDYIKATTKEYQGLAEAMADAAAEDVAMQAVAAAMPGIETGVVGFDDVTGRPGDPAPEQTRGPSDLTLRIFSGLVLVGILIGALILGGFWLWLFVLGVVMVALAEFYATVRRQGFAPVSLFGMLGAIGVFVAVYRAEGNTPLAVAGAIGLTTVATGFWYAIVPRRNPLANSALTVFGMAWVAGLMAFAVPIILAPRYKELILALALITGVFDIGSYFAGRAFGRTKMAKVLSPNKTLEGLLGGIVAAVATGVGLTFITWFGFERADGLLLGAVISVAAPLGDLAESMIKRSLNTKDMGAILPGHGGLLDRIDSFVFAVPACYTLFLWLGFLA